MAPRAKRPTLAALAAAAGVSRATASNAFNRPERLSAARRAEILALAEKMGYAGPNPTAASLRRGRTGAIGVIIPERLSYAFADPAAAMVLDGLAQALTGRDTGLLLLAGDGSGGGPSPAAIMHASVDAFVVYGLADGDPALDALRRRRLPMVFLDETPLRTGFLVDLDEEAGSEAVASHLVGLGHRRFGIVTMEGRPDGYRGPVTLERARLMTYHVTKRRLDAVLGVLQRAGVDPAEVAMYETPHDSPDEGEQAANWIFERSPRPTAIVCQSDQLAIGVLDAAHARGLRVPDDVSVAGFDDIDAAQRSEPPLTTVRQSLRDRGRLTGEFVLKALAGGRPRRERLPTELIVRGSTGRAPR